VRAVMFRGTRNVEVVEVPSAALLPDEVRLRVDRAGICGSDLATWRGDWPSPVVPSIKGHEVCGTIVETGAEVDAARVGELVAVRPIRGCGDCRYCQQGLYSRCSDFRMYGGHYPGGWAEEMVVRQDHARTLAPHVSMDDAGFAEPIAVVAHGFNLAGSLEGASVAVLGAGVLGLIAIQVARARGARAVYATGRQDKKLELAKQFGATVGDTRTQDVIAAGLEQGGPFDVVFDTIGSSEALNQALKLSARGGWVLLVAGPHEPTLSFDYTDHHRREVAIMSSLIYGEDFDDCLPLLNNGSLELAPLLTHRFPVKDAPAAVEFANANRSEVIKAMLQPSLDAW
jgi:2-desacetyl-2-hydroxyethyl bacteriochlorophyllide A dehydrogenase